MLKPEKLVFRNTYKDTCGFCHEESHVTWCADDNRALCQDCNNIVYSRKLERYAAHLEKTISLSNGEFNIKKPESMILEESIVFMLSEPLMGQHANVWITATLLARYKYNRFIMLKSGQTIALRQNDISNLVPLDLFDERVMEPARALCLKEQFGNGVSMIDLTEREIQLLNILAMDYANKINAQGEFIS
ncbi:hypothetical protein LMH73_024405 [Vibrio splendidus]|nr:hypothetical protein [Vibrio splendidus]MCC4880345.1 hypothetical protein [Vibrio splendidus]